jgi:hypothetical protein
MPSQKGTESTAVKATVRLLAEIAQKEARIEQLEGELATKKSTPKKVKNATTGK